MKKVLSLVVALFAVATSFAQADAGSVSIIPRAGISISNLTNIDGLKYKVGFVGGADVQFQFNDLLGLTAGAFFEMQGGKEKESKGNVNNNYINVPVLLNCYIVKGLQVKLGLQPGFLVSAKAVGKDGSGNSMSLDMKELYNTFDLSLPVGISYEISNFILDARYNLGLLKVAKNKYNYDNTESKSRNSVFQITLGYRFQL